jgi:hypothetical protein
VVASAIFSKNGILQGLDLHTSDEKSESVGDPSAQIQSVRILE